MKHILKFNESSDPNIGTLHDAFIDLEDDFNLKIKVERITEDRAYLNVVTSEIISIETDKTITPNFVNSVISGGDYHKQFKGSRDFDCDVDLIKKYMNYKFYRVIVDWSSLRNKFTTSEFFEKISKYSSIAESYGFINLYDEVLGFGPAIIVFAHE